MKVDRIIRCFNFGRLGQLAQPVCLTEVRVNLISVEVLFPVVKVLQDEC
jgi:hypothetical protein